MKRWIATLICGGLMAVWAQNYIDIALGGEFILRLRTGSSGYSLEERARIVEERLVNVLGTPLQPSDIRLKEVKPNAQYEIYVRQKLLLTVTPEDAKAAQMSIKQLAQHWLRALRTKLPELSAHPQP